MKATRFASTFLALSLMFTGESYASNYVNCFGCTQLQMANAALAHGVGRVLVGNLQTNTLIAFRISQGPPTASNSSTIPSTQLKNWRSLLRLG